MLLNRSTNLLYLAPSFFTIPRFGLRFFPSLPVMPVTGLYTEQIFVNETHLHRIMSEYFALLFLDFCFWTKNGRYFTNLVHHKNEISNDSPIIKTKNLKQTMQMS